MVANMGLEVQIVSTIASLLTVSAFYLSFLVYKKYQATSIGWGLLALAAGIIAFQSLAAWAWSFGMVNMTDDNFIALSCIMFSILSVVVFAAAWQVKKMTERYKLVERRQLKKFASDLNDLQARKRKKPI
jgi:hypothetical protein